MNDNSPEEDIAEALHRIAGALHALGVGDALTHMGAIELLASEIKNGSEQIAGGLHDIAGALRGDTN